jgi:hypothetical protein
MPVDADAASSGTSGQGSTHGGIQGGRRRATMIDHDSDLRDRLVAMQSRLETAAPPEIRSRSGRRFANQTA